MSAKAIGATRVAAFGYEPMNCMKFLWQIVGHRRRGAIVQAGPYPGVSALREHRQ